MQLFQDERIITSADGEVITLTNYRVRSSNSYKWGQHSTTSIMLEKVSAVQATSISYPWLLIVAGICALAAISMMIQGGQPETVIPVVLTVVLMAIYFSSRKNYATWFRKVVPVSDLRRKRCDMKTSSNL
jgi:hypothetical protein